VAYKLLNAIIGVKNMVLSKCVKFIEVIKLTGFFSNLTFSLSILPNSSES